MVGSKAILVAYAATPSGQRADISGSHTVLLEGTINPMRARDPYTSSPSCRLHPAAQGLCFFLVDRKVVMENDTIVFPCRIDAHLAVEDIPADDLRVSLRGRTVSPASRKANA